MRENPHVMSSIHSFYESICKLSDEDFDRIMKLSCIYCKKHPNEHPNEQCDFAIDEVITENTNAS